jgi:hypothetical protein
MLTTNCFLVVLFATVPATFGAPTSLEATSQAAVRLKLNAIETARFLERYEKDFAFRMHCEENIELYSKAAVDPEILKRQKSDLESVEDSLEKTKKKLVDLEVEKTKLIEQFGKPESADASTERMDKMNRTLQKILERLAAVENRLEKR